MSRMQQPHEHPSDDIEKLLGLWIAIGILAAAVHRFRNPQTVDTHALLIFASFGLALNILIAALFYRQSHHDLNIRGAFLHVLGDALGTLAVLIAGFFMMITHSI